MKYAAKGSAMMMMYMGMRRMCVPTIRYAPKL